MKYYYVVIPNRDDVNYIRIKSILKKELNLSEDEIKVEKIGI